MHKYFKITNLVQLLTGILIFDSVWCECLEKLSSDLFMFYTKPADTTFTSHKAAVLKYWNIEQQEFEILKAINIKSKQK